MSKRTRYSASSSVPHWQPISQLPLIAEMIDRQQESAAEVLHTLEAAREHPGALDDATVDRMIRLHSQQLEDVWVYDGQLQQWATQTLTDAQRREVDRLTGQAKKLRETLTAAVALAGELKPTTIESLLRMDDAELGLQTLLRGGPAQFRPVTPEQEKAARQIDAWVEDLEARGGGEDQMWDEMHPYLPLFEQVIEHLSPGDFHRLCAHHTGVDRLAKLFDKWADGIASGRLNADETLCRRH